VSDPKFHFVEKKMKAIVKKSEGKGLQLEEKPIPSPKEDEVLVKVEGAAICGSDVHIYDWDGWSQKRIKPPRVLGHEFCGEVVEVGRSVRRLQLGDFISVESRHYCGICYQCNTGKRHLCSRLEIVGVDTDGGFAEYAAIPETCAWKIDRSLPLEVASLMDPLGLAIHAALDEDVSGHTVAVFGCGPTGILAGVAAKAGGAEKVISISRTPFRLELAKKMGSDYVINTYVENPEELVREITGGEGVDFVLEMSGSQQAINTGLTILKRGGRLTAFGLPRQPVAVDWTNEVVMKGIRINAVMGRKIWETWYKMMGLLNTGKIDPIPVVTHRLPLSEFQKAFDELKSKEKKCGKVLLIP
jgi:threonine 3-dehydrogenase